jgi:hypothetical protein
MKTAALVVATFLLAAVLAVAVVELRGTEACTVTNSTLPVADVAFDLGAIPTGTAIPPSQESVPVTVPVGKTLIIRQWTQKCVPVDVAVEAVPGGAKPGAVRQLREGHVRLKDRVPFFALMRATSPGLVQVDLKQSVPSLHCPADRPCPALQATFPRILVRVTDRTSG